ncbi:MAG: SDR family oxidoreductase [Ktedonobacterales bacterium]|nr:SDR family oxidoreductase [Ktedonobacterales bacterium]
MSGAQTTAGQGQPLTDLRGQVAIVTGASSGIGEAVAEALAARGARVTLAARREERLRALAERLEGAGHSETLTVRCDVRQPVDVRAMVQRTVERWGQLDILVANAGFGWRGPLVDGDPQRWKDMLDTNVYGLLLTLKYGVSPLLERQRGHVIVLSSVAGRVVTAGGSAYCGSKFAASAIAEALRMEVGSRGVRVTTIEPGVVISEFQRVAEYPPEILPNMLKGAEPLVPADIARAVVYALEQPAHVGISELVIRPTGQTYP